MAKRIKLCECLDCESVIDACNCVPLACAAQCISVENGTPLGFCPYLATINSSTGPLVVTMQVRLQLTGLTIGQAYHARQNFAREDDPGITSFFDWFFTATATEETTSYADVPNPAGEDQPGWTYTTCTITPV